MSDTETPKRYVRPDVTEPLAPIGGWTVALAALVAVLGVDVWLAVVGAWGSSFAIVMLIVAGISCLVGLILASAERAPTARNRMRILTGITAFLAAVSMFVSLLSYMVAGGSGVDHATRVKNPTFGTKTTQASVPTIDQSDLFVQIPATSAATEVTTTPATAEAPATSATPTTQATSAAAARTTTHKAPALLAPPSTTRTSAAAPTVVKRPPPLVVATTEAAPTATTTKRPPPLVVAPAAFKKASKTSKASSSLALAALAKAETKKGNPYVFGATGPNAFDCSSLVQWAYKQMGVSIPRTSRAQSVIGIPVAKAELQPGDLVFFYSPVSHVGIYVGGGMIFNASTEGVPIGLSNMNYMPFHNARRILADASA